MSQFDIEQVPDAGLPDGATWWVEMDGGRLTVYVSDTAADDPAVVAAYEQACRRVWAEAR